MKESDQYVEFDKLGRIISGAVIKPRSRSVFLLVDAIYWVFRYEEDVLVNNHTSVWGSYWSKGQWGYACCHQFVKNSYCIGEKGKQIESEAIQIEPFPKAETRIDQREREKPSLGLALWGNDAFDGELDAKEVEAARKKLKQKRKLEDRDEKSRDYNSLVGITDEVTQADIEAYRLEKRHAADPLKDIEKAKKSQDTKDYGYV